MRTAIEGHTVETYPGLAPATFHVDWHHVPTGPFRTQAWHQAGDARMAAVETYSTFDVAMARFAMYFLPPLPGYTALLLDEGFRVVFGWCNTDQVLADNQGQQGWYGVREAFAWLEGLGEHDMLDLAVWEGRAMASATNVGEEGT